MHELRQHEWLQLKSSLANLVHYGAGDKVKRYDKELALNKTEQPGQPDVNDSDVWLKKCDDEYDQAYAAIQKNQEEYDKQLITLSAAFVTLTISFINNIVPLKEAAYRGLLYTSLITMSTCLLSVLISYQISIHFHYRAADFWKKSKNRSCSPEFPLHGATIVRVWNICNGFVFAAGIAFAVAFVVANLHKKAKETTMAKSHYATDGMPLKIPSNLGETRGQNIKLPNTTSNTQSPASSAKLQPSPSSATGSNGISKKK